jgi:hypothetical protein
VEETESKEERNLINHPILLLVMLSYRPDQSLAAVKLPRSPTSWSPFENDELRTLFVEQGMSASDHDIRKTCINWHQSASRPYGRNVGAVDQWRNCKKRLSLGSNSKLSDDYVWDQV